MVYRRIGAAVVLLLALTRPLSAQVLQSGTITAQDAGSCATATGCLTFQVPPGVTSLLLQVSGTYSGTLTFEATADPSSASTQTWFSLGVVKGSDGTFATTTTSTGQFSAPCAGFLQVRVRAGSFASGTATISFNRGYFVSRLMFPVFDTVTASHFVGGDFTGTTYTASTKFLNADGSASAPSYSFLSEPTKGLYSSATNQIGVALAGARYYNFTTTGINFTVNGSNTFLVDDATDTLACRRGTNACTFRIYRTFTDASNYARFSFGWSGNDALLTMAAAGTGTGGVLAFQTVGANAIQFNTNSTGRWQIDANGHFIAATDNTYDFGASAAGRAKKIYVANAFIAPAGTRYTDSADGIALLQNGAGTGFTRLILGTNDNTANGVSLVKDVNGNLVVAAGDNSGNRGITASKYTLSALAFSGTAPTISSGFGSSPSIAANNGTAAFTINVGNGGTASSGVIGLPTATAGWVVNCQDLTTPGTNVTKQTAVATNTATITNYNSTTGVAAAWTSADVLYCQATAY